MIKIPMLDLKKEYRYMKQDIDEAIQKCLDSQQWILGLQVNELEGKIAEYIGAKYAIGVSSGTDALVIALRALSIKNDDQEYFKRDDLVITTPFTFTATGDAILRAGATPLFVDINLDSFNIDPEEIEKAIKEYGNRIKGIVPVHLYGQPCNMDKIMRIAEKYSFFVVEDCAQSFGAQWDNKKAGSFGDVGCFSFFPSKNLGGFGDGGMITTNDNKLAEIISMLRRHGGKDKYSVDHIGYNARLDTIQAAILLAKMKYIDEFNENRRKIAQLYDNHLKNIEWFEIPKVYGKVYHVYHQYTVKILNGKRDEIQKRLEKKGIQTMIYYPVALHKMKVFKDRREVFGNFKNAESVSNNVLSLPIEPLYSREMIEEVVENITNEKQ